MSLDTQFRMIVMITSLLVVAAAIYWALVEVMARGLIPIPARDFPMADALRWLVIGAAGVAIVASRWIRRSILDARPGAEGFKAATITAFGLSEGAVVVGFAWFLSSGRVADFYACLGCGVIGFIVNWPRRSEWDDVVRGDRRVAG